MHLKNDTAVLHVGKALRFNGGVALPNSGNDALVRVCPHVRVLEPLSAGGAAVNVVEEEEEEVMVVVLVVMLVVELLYIIIIIIISTSSSRPAARVAREGALVVLLRLTYDGKHAT